MIVKESETVVVESPMRSTPLAMAMGLVERGADEAAQVALPPRPRPEILALPQVTRMAETGMRGQLGKVEDGACTSIRQFPFNATPTSVQLIVTAEEAATGPASGSESEKLIAVGDTVKMLITVRPRLPDSACFVLIVSPAGRQAPDTEKRSKKRSGERDFIPPAPIRWR